MVPAKPAGRLTAVLDGIVVADGDEKLHSPGTPLSGWAP